MPVRALTDEEELSVGSGLDIESRYYRQKFQITGHEFATPALQALADFTDPTVEVKLPINNGFQNFIFYRQPLTVRRVGHKLYESEVTWNLRQNSEYQCVLRARSTGGTQHILGSFFTAGHSRGAPDCRGLIGYEPDKNEVKGCEIVVPQFEMELEVTYPVGTATSTYLAALVELTGYVNNSKWLWWNAGQVLYKGAEFTKGTVEPTRIVHYLGIEKHLTNVTLCGLSGITKEGWDFLWFRTEDATDRGLPVKIPVHWYSERVYPRTNFAAVIGPLVLP